MKLNEAKFRSPKWLRNYVDFEVNTGDDISGEPSKGSIKREKKRKEKESRQNWDQRWRSCDEDEFKQFYKEVYNKGKTVYSFDIQDIRDKWRGDNRLWDSFDNWLDKKRKKEEAKEQIKKELAELIVLIKADFQKSPYRDKFTLSKPGGSFQFTYTFDDGRVFKLDDSNGYSLYWDKVVYTIGIDWRLKFGELIREIVGNAKFRQQQQQRSGYDRYNSYGSGSSSGSSGYRSSSSSSGSSQQQRKANTPPKWKDHPKGAMYQNLKDTVKLREEQLKRATGSDRTALENELNAAKRMLDNLNKKYNFESNIQNFIQFNQIFEKSKFVDTDEFNDLLDKINDGGITSLTDIEKKRLDLFSMDDEPILDVIERMGDLTAQFKIINKKLKDLQSQGKIVDAKNLFRDEWAPLNNEMMKLEKEIESYGIELGDETFMSMMNKHRADVYGYDPDKEGDDELEMDI